MSDIHSISVENVGVSTGPPNEKLNLSIFSLEIQHTSYLAQTQIVGGLGRDSVKNTTLSL